MVLFAFAVLLKAMLLWVMVVLFCEHTGIYRVLRDVVVVLLLVFVLFWCLTCVSVFVVVGGVNVLFWCWY